MKIQRNISLKKYNTFKTGGRARFFCEPKTTEELIEAVKYANKNKLKIFIIGGGSNLLISDSGFAGLIIKNSLKGITTQVSKSGHVEVSVGAGENWDEFVKYCVLKQMWGLENLSLIPGTVGAGCVQNIGAYGREISQVIKQVEVLDTKTLKSKLLSNKKCNFGYRNSIFKTFKGNNLIILKVVFSLKTFGVPKIDYKDLKEYFKNKIPKLLEIRKAIIKIRKNKLPNWNKLGTAGSFFKNPIITKKHFEKIKLKYPDIYATKVGPESYKVSLAWILDKVCNLNGFRIGNIGLHHKQPLVIVNYGKAKSKDIHNFSNQVVKIVKDQVGITPEREVVYVGDF